VRTTSGVVSRDHQKVLHYQERLGDLCNYLASKNCSEDNDWSLEITSKIISCFVANKKHKALHDKSQTKKKEDVLHKAEQLVDNNLTSKINKMNDGNREEL